MGAAGAVGIYVGVMLFDGWALHLSPPPDHIQVHPLDICDNILGRAFCPFGDGAVSPVMSSIKHFRDEYIEHSKRGGCPFDPAATTVFAAQSGGAR